MFDSVQVDLQGITLLEQAGRDNLINFANAGIGYIDYETYLTEVICFVLHRIRKVLLPYECIEHVATESSALL